ncbi:AzlC family ABC transporter permease [Streptomyces sp. NPDC047072]|uniref:AzlC family ABC transporter permease n=1 Tax=Streptomyces sp. NPDC047072 TaxID=3154809 RepID=UPI003411B130
MMATVTPLAAVALTVFVVNFRHVFYAFSSRSTWSGTPVAKAYAVYAMTDEAYAVNASLPEHERSAADSSAWSSARPCPPPSRVWSSPCAPCSRCSPWTRSAPARICRPCCSRARA